MVQSTTHALLLLFGLRPKLFVLRPATGGEEGAVAYHAGAAARLAAAVAILEVVERGEHTGGGDGGEALDLDRVAVDALEDDVAVDAAATHAVRRLLQPEAVAAEHVSHGGCGSGRGNDSGCARETEILVRFSAAAAGLH